MPRLRAKAAFDVSARIQDSRTRVRAFSFGLLLPDHLADDRSELMHFLAQLLNLGGGGVGVPWLFAKPFANGGFVHGECFCGVHDGHALIFNGRDDFCPLFGGEKCCHSDRVVLSKTDDSTTRPV